MTYDLGYFDLEANQAEPLKCPFQAMAETIQTAAAESRMGSQRGILSLENRLTRMVVSCNATN